ncbi:MAG: hypothetical protein PHC34_11430 [Candidatus Gastranaerophilales bacterium]|nr:hypothetical protein [Candidatus Gastranaerophilales bacterium]
MSDNEKFIDEKEQEVFRHFRLGEHLLQRNMLSLPQLNEALEIQKNTGKLIGEIFVECGYINLDELQEGLEHQHNADDIINNIKIEVKDKITFNKVDH